MSGRNETLFRLNAEDIDVLLPVMKERLMLQEEQSQIIVVERISDLLKSESGSAREAVLSKLIKYDVISTLLDALRSPADRLLPRVLDFLCLASNHRRFYEDEVAAEAVDSILKISYCASKSLREDARVLEKLVQTILDILRRAAEFGIDLDMVCVPRQFLPMLRVLILEDYPRDRLRFSGAALLNIILEATQLENCDDILVLNLCQTALNSMREIVEYSDDDAVISIAAVNLCGLCAAGTRLCSAEREEDTSENVEQSKEALIKSIYKTAMHNLIPYVKNAEQTQIDRIKFHGNLVTCLNNLYKLRSCTHDNLSNHLTANGYLKYFLRLTAGLPENLRRSTCMLLSRILSALVEKSTVPSSAGLLNRLYWGFLALPKDPDRWTDVISSETDSATALMILIYYHFHGTSEKDMISLKSLAARAAALSNREPVGPLILKILWFLFALAYNSHTAPHLEPGYAAAVKRLAIALQCSDLGKCYTHHVDLLRFCLKCPELPRDLLSKAMDLWLVESDGDVKPLLTLDCDRTVRHCLLIVVQSGQPEAIINLAVKGIRELMTVDNAKEIAEIAWQLLPSLLSSYHPEKDDRIKAILELTTVSTPQQVTINCIKRCADSLVNIILNKNADVKLRTLAVMQAYVLLAASVSAKSYRVLEKYVNRAEFLEELCAQGFPEDVQDLSAVCLKLLAFIIHCQQKSSVRCGKPLTIEVQRFADVLMKGRKSAHVLRNGMQLLLEVLSENIDGSAIKLKEVSADIGESGAIINLYETLHIIHAKSDPTQRDIVYQCLESILKHCHRVAESTMYLVCGLMSNYHLVTRALNKEHMSSNFLEFVSTWLRYRKRYSSEEGSWNPGSLCRTPFEETLDRIRKYLDTGEDAGLNDARYKLSYVLSIFEED